MDVNFEFPAMRDEVISALQSLSDAEHQRTVWGRVAAGINYYDDLTLNVHILYDDCQVLPDPDRAVPAILRPTETPAFLSLDAALGPILDELGDRPDNDYLIDPRWTTVIEAAAAALRAMGQGIQLAPNPAET